MTDRRELEREPNRTVYREREGSSTGILIGVVIALLVIAVVAFMFFRGTSPEPTPGDTNVTVETPVSPPNAAAEPPPPAPEPPAASAPAEPPAAPAPEAPAPATPEPAAPTAPDAAAPPAPAPAQ